MPVNDSSAFKLRPELGEDSDDATLAKYVSIELPDEAVAILNEVMRATGDTTEALFRKALALYKIAVDAKLDGYKMAIVDPEDDALVQYISGL